MQSAGRAAEDGLKAMEEEWEADKSRTRRVMKQTNDRRSVRSGGDAARGPGARLGAHLELWLRRRGAGADVILTDARSTICTVLGKGCETQATGTHDAERAICRCRFQRWQHPETCRIRSVSRGPR